MKIAIISDIHDNSHNLVQAFIKFKEKDIEQIIFLGDFMHAGIAKFLSKSKIPVLAIWGNNDGEKVAITKNALASGSNLTMSNRIYDFVEFDNKKMFLTHYHDLAKPMALSGQFDVVFYGHNHVKYIEQINDCLMVNPGEISAHKTGKASFAIYDTKSNTAEIIDIENSLSVRTNDVDKYFKEIDFEY